MRHCPGFEHRVSFPGPRPRVKYAAQRRSLSMRESLSAPSARRIVQVVEDPVRPLLRLRRGFARQRPNNLSKLCRLRADGRFRRRPARPESARDRFSCSSDGMRLPSGHNHPIACPAPVQRARAAPAAGEPIRTPYPTARTHPQPPATRLPSRGIYIWRLPRLRPTAPTAACALSGRPIAFYMVFLDNLWR